MLAEAMPLALLVRKPDFGCGAESGSGGATHRAATAAGRCGRGGSAGPPTAAGSRTPAACCRGIAAAPGSGPGRERAGDSGQAAAAEVSEVHSKLTAPSQL